MQVIRAEAMGLCFGVRDAIEQVESITNAEAVTIHGELVHNKIVLHQLKERGFQMVAETDRQSVPESSEVLITAHGVSERERSRLLSAGKRLIDTTCPLVRIVHQAAQQLEAEGFHVIVIGRKGHVEVQGIVEDLARYDVIARKEEVKTWPYSRLGIVCQTHAPLAGRSNPKCD